MSDIGITITFYKRESKCIINVVMSSDGICGIQLTAYKTKYHSKSSKIHEKKAKFREKVLSTYGFKSKKIFKSPKFGLLINRIFSTPSILELSHICITNKNTNSRSLSSLLNINKYRCVLNVALTKVTTDTVLHTHTIVIVADVARCAL